MQINVEQIQRILIIQIRPFGDVLLNTGYLPFLRKKLPRARIDFLAKHPFDSVLANNPHIDDVVVFGKSQSHGYWLDKLRLMFFVRRQRYDVIIDQIQGTTSAQIVMFSRAKYRIAAEGKKWSWLYNIRVPQAARYSGSMKFDLLKPLGIREAPYRLHYHVQPQSVAYIQEWLAQANPGNDEFICISPGSPRIKKKWGAACFAALGDLILKNTDRKVVLLWGPHETEDLERVQAAMTLRPLIAPATSYNQAAALLKASELLVCNDGGLNHLSVATGTPSLAVFGGTSPKFWSPQAVFPNHYHLANADWDGRSDDFGITPEAVFNKIQVALGWL
jgi:ADP-heptose:LPS heptosyltransferase